MIPYPQHKQLPFLTRIGILLGLNKQKPKIQIPAQPVFRWVVFERSFSYSGQALWNDTPVLDAVMSKQGLCAWLAGHPAVLADYLRFDVYDAQSNSPLGQWIGPGPALYGQLGCS